MWPHNIENFSGKVAEIFSFDDGLTFERHFLTLCNMFLESRLGRKIGMDVGSHFITSKAWRWCRESFRKHGGQLLKSAWSSGNKPSDQSGQ